MKPNGKYLVVRAVLLVLCIAGSFAAMANAATVRGKFKLATETRWGKLLLAPGEYEFTFSSDGPGTMVTVRSEDSGRCGVIMSVGMSDPTSAEGSSLQLGRSESGMYVQSLALGDLGMTLKFTEPKAGKVTRLSLPQPVQVASASGSH